MKKTFSNIHLIIIAVILFSCNPELKLELPDPDDRIVIDGWIESMRTKVLSSQTG